MSAGKRGGVLGLRADMAGLRMSLSLVHPIRKHNFNPGEARIPAGQTGGGRWTRIGNGPGARATIVSRTASNHGEAIVPDHPGKTNVDRNIAIARSMRSLLFPPLNLLWFYDQVRSKGPWDYKRLNRAYEDFGNFNYGAAGAIFLL